MVDDCFELLEASLPAMEVHTCTYISHSCELFTLGSGPPCKIGRRGFREREADIGAPIVRWCRYRIDHMDVKIFTGIVLGEAYVGRRSNAFVIFSP